MFRSCSFGATLSCITWRATPTIFTSQHQAANVVKVGTLQPSVTHMFNAPKNTKSSLPEQFGKAEVNRRRSVLHDGIRIEGQWVSDGIVEFGGQFRGELSVETLVLTKDGRINGDIRAQIVTIEGMLDGTILAQSVNIKTSATVKADIQTESISIDSGAAFEGRISCKGEPSDR